MNSPLTFDEFPRADWSAWAALVARAIGDPSGPESLVARTRDDIPVEPLYPQRHPGRDSVERWGRWRIFQRVDHPDIKQANALARADLEGGADGLEIVFPGSAAAHGFGVGVDTLDDLDRLLADIDLVSVPLRLDGGYEVRQAIAFTTALVERRGIDPAQVDIVAESDPANGLFSDGRLVVPYELTSDWAADMVQGLLRRGLRLPVFVGEGRAVHAAGGTEAQELAYALASGVEHLRMLESRGVALEDAAGMVTFNLAADADQFLTIAKLRAFRLVWAQVIDVVGLPERAAYVHVETSWRMMTRRDPWVNMLRASVATAAAGLGGADSVLALPFTQAIGLPDAFARRVARNCQLILLEEAGLANVADPAAGAGYIEAMTEALADTAWGLFRAVEREGGIIASLRQGSFQAQVLRDRERRADDAARLVEPIIGVSEYPWLEELAADILRVQAHEVHASGDSIDLPAPGGGARFEGLVEAVRAGATMADILATIGYEWEHTEKAPWWRIAEPFERLRDAGDAALAETGQRPAVFLANLGQLSEFSTLAAWASGVFETGGLATIAGRGGGEGDAIAGEFSRSGAGIACICAPAGHEERIPDISRWLRTAGARHVLCASQTGGDEAALRGAGIDAALYEGCDILTELENLHDQLGLEEPEAAGRHEQISKLRRN